MRRRRSVDQQQSQVSLARFGAVVALMGAALGAAGAGIPTLIASNSQIAAEGMQSSSEFRREQRLDAYVAYIQSAEALLEAEYESHLALRSNEFGPYIAPGVANPSVFEDFSSAWSVVQLVGSEQAIRCGVIFSQKVELLETLAGELRRMLEQYGSDEDQWTNEVQEEVERRQDQIVERFISATDWINPFSEQARLDLGQADL